MSRFRPDYHAYGLAAPCKDCEDRHEGCHTECDKYKEYKAELDKRKEEARSRTCREARYVDTRFGRQKKSWGQK